MRNQWLLGYMSKVGTKDVMLWILDHTRAHHNPDGAMRFDSEAEAMEYKTAHDLHLFSPVKVVADA